MAASPQTMFNLKLLKLVKVAGFTGDPEDETLAAEYIQDHRNDARLHKFLETKLCFETLVEALLASSSFTLRMLMSKTLFEAIQKNKDPSLWKQICAKHISRDKKFLKKLNSFNLRHWMALSTIDFEIEHDPAKEEPKAKESARKYAGAGAGAGFAPGFDRARAENGARPSPSLSPAPKREFSAFEEAMGRADYLNTKAHKKAMEERKQHQEDRIKKIIVKYVAEGVDVYKPFGTKEEVEKMSSAEFKRKFAQLGSAPGDKDLELLTNAKEILQNPTNKAYYDKKVAEKGARVRPSA